MSTKLLVVVGATSRQGGGVINEFLQDPRYKIRGITRHPSSAAGQKLAANGVEVVAGDLLNVDSLIEAFKGANVIYAMTTDLWTNLPLIGPATPTKSVLELSYDMELAQGRNILNAALTVLSSLEMLIFSTLAAVRHISRGKYTQVYHFDAKGDLINELRTKHPELARRTKALMLGYFMHNWKGPTPLRPTKLPDGTYEIAAVGPGTTPTPFVMPDRDPAIFVHALAQTPLSNQLTMYLGYGDMLSFEQWAQLLGKVLDIRVRYRELSVQAFSERISLGPEIGRSLGEMYGFTAEYGYDGGELGVVHMKDVQMSRKPLTMEEYFRQENWSEILE